MPRRTDRQLSGGSFARAGNRSALGGADYFRESEGEDDERADGAGWSGGKEAGAGEEGAGGILKPKLIALNLLLLLALGFILWQARLRWNDAKIRRESNLHVQVK